MVGWGWARVRVGGGCGSSGGVLVITDARLVLRRRRLEAIEGAELLPLVGSPRVLGMGQRTVSGGGGRSYSSSRHTNKHQPSHTYSRERQVPK